MKTLQRSAIAVVAAIVIALGGGAASAPATTPHSVQIACKRAIIGGKSKCIAAGQFCAHAQEHDYNRYGYTCSKRDRNGRYHLKKL